MADPAEQAPAPEARIFHHPPAVRPPWRSPPAEQAPEHPPVQGTPAPPPPAPLPRLITSRAFYQACLAAGVVEPGRTVRRLVIDACQDSALVVYVEYLGDEQWLDVVPCLTGVEVHTRGDAQTPAHAGARGTAATQPDAQQDEQINAQHNTQPDQNNPYPDLDPAEAQPEGIGWDPPTPALPAFIHHDPTMITDA